jgi:hypothetical protein
MAAPLKTSQLVVNIADKVARIGGSMQMISRIGKNGQRDGQIVSKILGGRLNMERRHKAEAAAMAMTTTNMHLSSWERRVNSKKLPDFYGNGDANAK